MLHRKFREPLPLLASLAKRFEVDRPFGRMAISACLHVTAETAVFVRALQAGGATACIMAMQAAALVESGQCRNVLCVTGDNRLIGYPYPKLLNANIQTDQAAALILCSAEAAAAAGKSSKSSASKTVKKQGDLFDDSAPMLEIVRKELREILRLLK